MIVCRIMETLHDPQAEQVLGGEIGQIERIHVGTQAAAKEMREVFLVFDRRNRGQVSLHWSKAPGLYPGFVHVSIENRAHTLRVGVSVAIFCGLADQVHDPFVGRLGQNAAHSPAAFVDRNLSAVNPAAVDVAVEIIAGPGVGVDASEGGFLRIGRMDELHAGEQSAKNNRCRQGQGAFAAGYQGLTGSVRCFWVKAQGRILAKYGVITTRQ